MNDRPKRGGPRPSWPCRCGCGQRVVWKPGTKRPQFFNRQHYAAYVNSPQMAEYRAARAEKAGRAARQAHLRTLADRIEGLTSAEDAYRKGYKVGFQRAMRWWRHKYRVAFSRWQATQGRAS